MSDFGGKHRFNVTGLYHDMWGFPTTDPKQVQDLSRHLIDKIRNNGKAINRHKEYYLDDADYVLISYGSSARSALHVVERRRERGEAAGLLELQTLWPFPYDLVRKKCDRAKHVIVVEMNMGQMVRAVKRAVTSPDKVFLSNRMDGQFITHADIRKSIRFIQGLGG